MKKGSLLQIGSGLAVAGLVAYKLATAPLAGMEAAPISASAAVGPPTAVASTQTAVPISAIAREAALLQKAYTAQTMDMLGMRVLDLNSRGTETLVNVQLSADAVDSTILQPNDVFSFNDIVGVRTSERGYQSGLMYSSGQLITGVGGGICITSTVIYNVALETGMAILERHPHSGPVAYAVPGRDSAVAYGALDLQFRNNTGSAVLIRSMVEDGKLVVAFYGKKKPGREIEITTDDFEPIPYAVEEKEDPSIAEGESKVDQKGHPGYSVTTVRIVKQNGKVISREMVSRDYMRPRDEVMLVHPKDETDSPVERIPGLIPMPYSTKIEMPAVELKLPDPTARTETGDTLPTPDTQQTPDTP